MAAACYHRVGLLLAEAGGQVSFSSTSIGDLAAHSSRATAFCHGASHAWPANALPETQQAASGSLHSDCICQSCASQITFECTLSSYRGQDGRTGLLAMARDHSAPPTATATGALTASSALRETVTQLGMAIPGEQRSVLVRHRGCNSSSAYEGCKTG